MSAIRFALTSADPDRLAVFYRDALGFAMGEAFEGEGARYGVEGRARVVPLRLGEQRVELVGFDPPGPAYPAGSTSHDSWFQHLALVATDIDAVFARLGAVPGWSPISTASPNGDGPVQLPASSGGVRAFKFRDPEGHPLELLMFPPGQAPEPWSRFGAGEGPLVGIDHSAIVVSDLEASLGFYARFGFAVTAQSENAGPEQDALDGATGVSVSVRALSRGDVPPHLELLAYRTPGVRRGLAAPTGVACTRTLLDGTGLLRRDPDGHAVMVAERG